MTNIIFQIRRPNTQEKSATYKVFNFPAEVHFSHFLKLKAPFLYRSIYLQELYTKDYRVFGCL